MKQHDRRMVTRQWVADRWGVSLRSVMMAVRRSSVNEIRLGPRIIRYWEDEILELEEARSRRKRG